MSGVVAMVETVVRYGVAGSSGVSEVVMLVSVTQSWKPKGSMGDRLREPCKFGIVAFRMRSIPSMIASSSSMSGLTGL